MYYSYRELFSVFFNDTATTEIYTLSLHDALPISSPAARKGPRSRIPPRNVHARGAPRTPSPSLRRAPPAGRARVRRAGRSEEHTSELQSRQYLVCRLLLEKKKHIHVRSSTHDLPI